MTENDEKLAEQYAIKNTVKEFGESSFDHLNLDARLYFCGLVKGFLAGLAHERARSQKLMEALREISTYSTGIGLEEIARLTIKEYESRAE